MILLEKIAMNSPPQKLYLLRMDNAAHAYNPNSNDIKNFYLDQLVKRTEDPFTDFFHDNRTIIHSSFSADHGMAKCSFHGSGNERETHVSVLAWGVSTSKG